MSCRAAFRVQGAAGDRFCNSRGAAGVRDVFRGALLLLVVSSWVAVVRRLVPVRKEVVDFKLSPFGRHTFYGIDLKP